MLGGPPPPPQPATALDVVTAEMGRCGPETERARALAATADVLIAAGAYTNVDHNQRREAEFNLQHAEGLEEELGLPLESMWAAHADVSLPGLVFAHPTAGVTAPGVATGGTSSPVDGEDADGKGPPAAEEEPVYEPSDLAALFR